MPTTPPPFLDLTALSALLVESNQRFRETFKLGGFPSASEAASEAAPAPAVPAAVSPDRSRFLHQMLAVILAKTGIDMEASQRGKMAKVLAGIPDADLAGWVRGLEAAAPDDPEWVSFIETLTIHETYFFRDPGQLAFIGSQVLDRLVESAKRCGRFEIRCWSAGCSTGEEAYSLAIMIVVALKEAGEAEVSPFGAIHVNPKWRISVLGTDLSRLVLRRARAGTYPDFAMGSFRGMPAGYDSFFEAAAKDRNSDTPCRQVRPEIRTLTAFEPFNLNSPEPPERDLDLILCRNVLIYFDETAKERTQRMIHKALRPGGHLALGATDVLKHPELFKPCWGPSTVLYQKR